MNCTATLHTVTESCVGCRYDLCQCDDTERAVIVTVTGTVASTEPDAAVVITSATLNGEAYRLSAAEVDSACEELFAVAVEQQKANDVCAATWAALVTA